MTSWIDAEGKRENRRTVPRHRDPSDVAIHCGDLTTDSVIADFRSALEQLEAVRAPLRPAIAGNHDFTLDIAMFRKKAADARLTDMPGLVVRTYGHYGEVRELFETAREHDVHLLDEGTHYFTLANGAVLTVYASPFTLSLGDWGFQFRPNDGHEFAIAKDTDIVITHGPPAGILDGTADLKQAGSSDLFAAVARARPRLHCFGHIHESWGAKLVAWRESISAVSSHLTDVENGRSTVVDSLQGLGFRTGTTEDKEEAERLEQKEKLYSEKGSYSTSHCSGDDHGIKHGQNTLFVNAVIEGDEEHPIQPAWLVDLELPSLFTDESGNSGGNGSIELMKGL
ncbi:metallophosphoesterase domain containing protein [Grosmannia clavigera kw1407]|uniref:Metallophosphoesterase domain containing protein n=1 Tax=Grosmannia clavigera (strain kw1407 / UAMH 11150) TaxID=655863 RepID=F0XER4_GROCL|nr:metallophosphoesterase domain containing protein [Grosmannia clavigera kw1407]EFX04548.1 metallophosphoesterase domain containing protein [Grosmannia clavigera kw1407]